MSEQPRLNTERFDELMSDVLEGNATPEQVELFNACLRQDPDARARYIAYIDLHAALADPAGPLQDPAPDDLPDVMSEIVDQALAMRRQHEIEDEANRKLAAQQAEEARSRRFELRRQAEPEPVKRVVVIPRIAVVGAIAAVLLIAVGVLYRPAPPDAPRSIVEQPAEEEQAVVEVQAVALLLDAHEPTWGQAAPKPGERMLPGEYELLSGAVQIAFDRGATVLIEGPAQFELIDDNAGRLSLGNLCAQVPESAQGFTIDLPRGKLIDLGTAFGVRISEAGETETVVFDGLIEARAITRDGMFSPPLRLNQGEGARLAQRAEAFEAQPVDPRQFARDLRGVSHDVRVSGAAKWLDTPPATVEVDQLEDHTTAVVFRERTGVRLRNHLVCGITEPGRYDTAALQHASATLAPQTVDSYLIHSDTELGKYLGPAGTPDYLLEMTVVFPRPIVAILTHADQMVATDALLGTPQTRYDGYAGRSLVERDTPDSVVVTDYVWLSEDRRTLRVLMHASNADQLRVLTEAVTPVSSFGGGFGLSPGPPLFLSDRYETFTTRCHDASI